jgi:hypothetical protein
MYVLTGSLRGPPLVTAPRVHSLPAGAPVGRLVGPSAGAAVISPRVHSLSPPSRLVGPASGRLTSPLVHSRPAPPTSASAGRLVGPLVWPRQSVPSNPRCSSATAFGSVAYARLQFFNDSTRCQNACHANSIGLTLLVRPIVLTTHLAQQVQLRSASRSVRRLASRWVPVHPRTVCGPD